MDDNNPWQLRYGGVSCGSADGAREVSSNEPVTLRRGNGLVTGVNSIVGPGHLLAMRIVGHQSIDHGRRGETADRESLHPGDEVAPADFPVNEKVVEFHCLAGQRVAFG